MTSISNLATSLTDTLKNSDLQGVTTEWSEVFLDTLLEDGILKDIPIISSIIGIGKTGMKISEMLLMKKLLYFITQVNEIPAHEREKVISEIDNSKSYRIKVGEKLLYIINECDDHEKSEIMGKLSIAVHSRSIDWEDFLKCSLVIEKCMVKDLIWFIKSDTNSYIMKECDSAEFLNWGLLEFAPLELKVEEKRNRSMGAGGGYEITNKDLKLKISPSGEIIRSCLKGYVVEKIKELKITQMNLLSIENHISIIAKGFEKERRIERLHQEIQEVLNELCNNYVLNDNEFKSIFTDIMTITGKHSITYITRQLKDKYDEVLKSGNDFNFDRWEKFSTDFIKEHDIKDWRDTMGGL
ncbi:hypothetical protein IWX83_003352 [Flavobacterium sp. CG_9.1]|uniref:hypothetical protein n=1 Tax=Flavobacterium sp. CG_9.1 TaxID=2787728 RepID=UPI0018CA0312|nr:hypothetical protein [Flavobacterium sp. CG_9.1]MBG6063542.1 hypothetical protein [Flavobacterium sp. CG_9.1]